MPAQSYATHRKWVPLWHYLATPIALLGLIKSLYDLRFGTDLHAIEQVVFMVGFAATAYLARASAVTVQNRLIRLEERLRLQSVLPGELKGAELVKQEIRSWRPDALRA